MSTPDKCPHCGAARSGVLFDGDVSKYYDCESSDFADGPFVGVHQSIRCKWNAERAAHAETRKQYMELIMAVARKFDGETRHQTALRYIKHAEDRARESGKADAGMTRLDAEAKEGQR